MSRRKPRDDWTPAEIIADVIAWADQERFFNIANELRRALAQLAQERKE